MQITAFLQYRLNGSKAGVFATLHFENICKDHVARSSQVAPNWHRLKQHLRPCHRMIGGQAFENTVNQMGKPFWQSGVFFK
jgi:hypothetical protein